MATLSKSPDAYPAEISVEEAHHLMTADSENVQLIDVRENDEREICKIEAARHIPMQQIPENVATLPRDKHLLIHCHHGGRSGRVTQYLRAHGFTAVTNVAGGIDAWADRIDRSLKKY